MNELYTTHYVSLRIHDVLSTTRHSTRLTPRGQAPHALHLEIWSHHVTTQSGLRPSYYQNPKDLSGSPSVCRIHFFMYWFKGRAGEELTKNSAEQIKL
jgi:hypothetical protein